VVKVRPSPSLHYPDHPFHQFLRNAADRYGERVVLRFDDEQLTFRTLDARGTAFANALLRAGFEGGRVILASANRPEWLMALHGVSQAGGAAVLVNSSWKQAELRHAVELTRPAALVADGPMADVLDRCGASLPTLKVCLDDDPPPAWRPFWDVVAGAPGRRPPDLEGDLGRREVVLPFSSGTTGLPKAVRHSHRSLVAATTQRVSAYGISDADRLQFFMPLFTIYGVAVAGSVFASGATLRLFRRFDAETVLRNLEEERITVGFAAAPVAVALRDRPDLERYDLSALRYLMWGATPVVRDVAAEVTARSGIRWFVAYAATEVPIAANPIATPEAWRLDSPGMPLPDTEVRTADLTTGEPLPRGAEGELQVRSPAAMMGYLPEEATAEVVLPDGWVRTGDVGRVDEEGWLHLTDRAKEMMKVNGFAVAPAELESTLFRHPAVADCAVYGIPHRSKGEVPKAAVVRAPGATVTAEELQAFVAGELATYKHLAAVQFVDAIPRNAGGKVLRRVLREADPDARLPVG